MSVAVAQQSGLMIDGVRKGAMESVRNRLAFIVACFMLAFVVMMGRVLTLGVTFEEKLAVPQQQAAIAVPEVQYNRVDILDRNGDILATNLPVQSLSANPSMVKDPAEAAKRLVQVLPELSYEKVRSVLASKKKFVWLKRKLKPQEQQQVNALGIPAFKLMQEEERIYPQGRLAAHVLGFVNVDGSGLAGIEHYLNDRMRQVGEQGGTVQLSLDLRVQHALTDELATAMRAHQAKGAAGLVMDVNNGEIVAMASLPDFDPNVIPDAKNPALFNRVTKGVYELGSTFKTFTFAAAFDEGVVTMQDGFDATQPITYLRHTINDDHPKKRWLNVPEIFAYSSNIGTAKMALELGAARQKAFLDRLEMLTPATVELTEVGMPQYPSRWSDIYTMTVSYGHGIAVSPLQLSRGIAAMVNGGRLIPATLVKKDEVYSQGRQVVRTETSSQIRKLMRMAVREGTGGKADAIGYRVGGKTGTAEKAVGGSYARRSLLSSFVGAFPMDDPQYVVFAMLDEPKGTDSTFGYRSGGWTAAPVVRNVIMRTAPLLGVKPKMENESAYQQVAVLIRE